jgi:hypothetical protein
MNFEIYCDESRPDLFTSKSTEKDKFLLIGSLWLPIDKRNLIKQRIKTLKDKHKIGGQIKWQRVSKSRLEFYKELIDIFMSFGKDLRFRSIAIEAEKVNFEIFHEDDKELGFYKFYYQMIHHWIFDFNEYKIFCDAKTNRKLDRLKILKKSLNNANLSSSIQFIQALPSKESVLIQLTDFLLGAIGGKLNKSIREHGAKNEVIKHLESRLGVNKLCPTGKNEEKFNVFKIHLEGGW